MSQHRPRLLGMATALAVSLSILAAAGCGKGGKPQPAEKAEAAVEQFLEAWSRGERPEQFASKHPKLSASDPDWQAGWRLLSFLSVRTEQTQPPPGFRCRFALSLRDPKGKAVEKEVAYEVTPGEKWVITRAPRQAHEALRLTQASQERREHPRQQARQAKAARRRDAAEDEPGAAGAAEGGRLVGRRGRAGADAPAGGGATDTGRSLGAVYARQRGLKLPDGRKGR